MIKAILRLRLVIEFISITVVHLIVRQVYDNFIY